MEFKMPALDEKYKLGDINWWPAYPQCLPRTNWTMVINLETMVIDAVLPMDFKEEHIYHLAEERPPEVIINGQYFDKRKDQLIIDGGTIKRRMEYEYSIDKSAD